MKRMRKFIIERNIPGIGNLSAEQLKGGAAKSNEALAKLAPDIEWVHSYVAENQTFCVYLARDEDVIRKHAELSGFPADRITEVSKKLGPSDGK
jgi:hypothetical protein